MVDVFVEKCGTMNLSNMIQLSMDGPNVNWSFYQKLMSEVYDDRSRKLIDIGSCGLHVVHNAFRAGFGATGWDLKSFSGHCTGFSTKHPPGEKTSPQLREQQCFP